MIPVSSLNTKLQAGLSARREAHATFKALLWTPQLSNGLIESASSREGCPVAMTYQMLKAGAVQSHLRNTKKEQQKGGKDAHGHTFGCQRHAQETHVLCFLPAHEDPYCILSFRPSSAAVVAAGV